MTEFSLAILSPDREWFAGSAGSVIAPGQDGEFGVLAKHIPTIAGLKPGVVLVREIGGRALWFAVDGGVLGVDGNGVRILVGRAAACSASDGARKAAAAFAHEA